MDANLVMLALAVWLDAYTMPPDARGCREWRGRSRTHPTRGYAQTMVSRKRYVAHRFVWETVIGPIPDGMMVLHRCDNPPCCNPDHLFLGTHLDNMADMRAKGRHGGVPFHKNKLLNSPRICGSKHYRAQVTEADVRRIRLLKERGLSYREIGWRFGITKANVGLICRRKAWKHV